MDVLLVTATVGGGVGRHVHHLADGLLARGHRVAVACPGAVEERFAFGALGAAVVPVELGRGLRPGDARAVATLRGLGAHVDVVHAHGIRAGAAAALARRAQVPLVVTTHNAAPEGAPAVVVHRALETVVHRRADLVLGVSPDLVRRARRDGARASDLAVVPAGVLPLRDPAERARARRRLRAELDLPPHDGPPVILSVGRLAEQKRMDLLVQAYHRMLRTGADPVAGSDAQTGPRASPQAPPVLLIAGEGPGEQQLRELARRGPGDVRLLGHRTDVADLLAGADLVVSSAVWEGQPLGLQEALAAGAPVVATDVGGTGLVLSGAGLLVPGEEPRVVADLADAMGRVLADDDLRRELSAASLRRAGELPGLDDAVTAALAAYARAGVPRHTGPGGSHPAPEVT